MTSLRQSLALTFLSTNGATAVQFLVTVVLARLLSPADIGIYSITAVMVSVAQLFRDFGVASYLQQEKELSREKVGAAFGVLLTSSWLIAAAMFALSWPASWFYKEPGVKDVMQVLSMGFLFIPFGAVTHSLLTRDYRAKEQAYVRVVGTLAYAVSAIGLAQAGFGHMSMAWASLINIIATAIGYIPFRPAIMPWLPRFSGWRRIVSFGAGATVSSSLEAVNNALPDVVLGKMSGPHDVGLLSRGMGTANLLNQVLGPTMSYGVLPYLSRAHHAGESLTPHLTRACAYATGLMWPALLCTAVLATPLIAFLYGDKWLPAASIVQWACGMFMLSVPFNFNPASYMAIGRPQLTAIPTLLSLTIRLLAVALVYDGSLNSFAVALFAAAVVMYPAQAWIQQRILGVPWAAFLNSQSRSLLIAGVCMGVALLVQRLTAGSPSGVTLGMAAIVVPATWLVLILTLRHPLAQELLKLSERFPRAGRWLRRLHD